MQVLKTGVLVLLMLFGLGSHAKETRTPDFKNYPALNVVEYRKHLDSNLPDFKQYPAKAAYTGKPAKVVLDTPEAKMFRTRLREFSTRPADFAGEYVVARWGCGTSCVYGAVVNLRTGKTAPIPSSVCCWGGEEDYLQYRKDSRLFIAYGRMGEGDPYGRHYYEFTGHEFKLIRTVPMEDTYMKDFGIKVEQELEKVAASMEQKKQLQALLNDGQPHGWLGIEVQESTAGALIVGVLKDAPAAKAGIKPGDVLTAVNGKPVTNSDSLLMLIAALKPGESATVVVMRRNTRFEFLVKAARRPTLP